MDPVGTYTISFDRVWAYDFASLIHANLTIDPTLKIRHQDMIRVRT